MKIADGRGLVRVKFNSASIPPQRNGQPNHAIKTRKVDPWRDLPNSQRLPFDSAALILELSSWLVKLLTYGPACDQPVRAYYIEQMFYVKYEKCPMLPIIPRIIEFLKNEGLVTIFAASTTLNLLLGHGLISVDE